VTVSPLEDGLSSSAYAVESAGERFVLRLAEAPGVHPVDRAAELAATEAAARCGIGPELVFADDAVLVRRFVEGRTLDAEDWRSPATRRQAVSLIARVPRELATVYRGPRLDRSSAATLGHYQRLLQSRPSPWQAAAAERRALTREALALLSGLPSAIGHNDVHGANIVDDGARLWLIDWEYAGVAPPLCDLASLLVNAQLDQAEAAEAVALWSGLGGIDPRRLAAARLAAALRDLFWGYAQALSEGFPGAGAYIAENERRVTAEADALRTLG
jgi:thiamine kinase-like enzyme